MAEPFSEDYTVDVDGRGETLTYVEQKRSVSMIWASFAQYQLYLDTIRYWNYPDGRSSPVSEEERDEVVRRVCLWMRDKQGIRLKPE